MRRYSADLTEAVTDLTEEIRVGLKRQMHQLQRALLELRMEVHSQKQTVEELRLEVKKLSSQPATEEPVHST